MREDCDPERIFPIVVLDDSIELLSSLLFDSFTPTIAFQLIVAALQKAIRLLRKNFMYPVEIEVAQWIVEFLVGVGQSWIVFLWHEVSNGESDRELSFWGWFGGRNKSMVAWALGVSPPSALRRLL